MLRRIVSFCSLGAAVVASACNNCPTYKCASMPAIEIVATDAATHAPLTAATVSGSNGGTTVTFGGYCGPSCRVGYASGETVVTVQADGYQSATLTVNVPDDTCGHPVSQHRDVALQKTGATSAALVVESLGPPGCGQ